MSFLHFFGDGMKALTFDVHFTEEYFHNFVHFTEENAYGRRPHFVKLKTLS